jgi:hypothetical protein
MKLISKIFFILIASLISIILINSTLLNKLNIKVKTNDFSKIEHLEERQVISKLIDSMQDRAYNEAFIKSESNIDFDSNFFTIVNDLLNDTGINLVNFPQNIMVNGSNFELSSPYLYKTPIGYVAKAHVLKKEVQTRIKSDKNTLNFINKNKYTDTSTLGISFKSDKSFFIEESFLYYYDENNKLFQYNYYPYDLNSKFGCYVIQDTNNSNNIYIDIWFTIYENIDLNLNSFFIHTWSNGGVKSINNYNDIMIYGLENYERTLIQEVNCADTLKLYKY